MMHGVRLGGWIGFNIDAEHFARPFDGAGPRCAPRVTKRTGTRIHPLKLFMYAESQIHGQNASVGVPISSEIRCLNDEAALHACPSVLWAHEDG